MDWLHLYIGVVAFSVFALVGLVLLISFDKIKINYDNGLFTYLKFIWANFLKPHERNGQGQQHALESFYKTQVRLMSGSCLCGILTTSRRPSTTQLADVFSMVGRICSDWWLLS
jgi:betaine lipid synthase